MRLKRKTRKLKENMIFNSVVFVIFYIIVTALYFILPHKFRWGLLLAASCYFYMAFVPVYILILGFTIVIDYFAGIFIEWPEIPLASETLLPTHVLHITADSDDTRRYHFETKMRP